MKNTNDAIENRTRNLPADIYKIFVTQYEYGLLPLRYLVSVMDMWEL